MVNDQVMSSFGEEAARCSEAASESGDEYAVKAPCGTTKARRSKPTIKIAPEAEQNGDRYAENLKRFETLIAPKKPSLSEWTESDEAALEEVRLSLESAFSGERSLSDAWGSVLDISKKLTMDRAPPSVSVSDIANVGYEDVEFVMAMEFPQDDAYYYYLAKVSNAEKHKEIWKKKKFEIKRRKAEQLKAKTQRKEEKDLSSKKNGAAGEPFLKRTKPSNDFKPISLHKNGRKAEEKERSKPAINSGNERSKGDTDKVSLCDSIICAMDKEHKKSVDRENLSEFQRYQKYRRERMNSYKNISSSTPYRNGQRTSSISSTSGVISDESERSLRKIKVSFGEVLCKVFDSEDEDYFDPYNEVAKPVHMPQKSPLRSALKGSRQSLAASLCGSISPSPSIVSKDSHDTVTSPTNEQMNFFNGLFSSIYGPKKEAIPEAVEPKAKKIMSFEDYKKRKATEEVGDKGEIELKKDLPATGNGLSSSSNMWIPLKRRAVPPSKAPEYLLSAMSSMLSSYGGDGFSPGAPAMKEPRIDLRIDHKKRAGELIKEENHDEEPIDTPQSPTPTYTPQSPTPTYTPQSPTITIASLPPPPNAPVLQIPTTPIREPKNFEFVPIKRRTPFSTDPIVIPTSPDRSIPKNNVVQQQNTSWDDVDDVSMEIDVD